MGFSLPLTLDLLHLDLHRYGFWEASQTFVLFRLFTSAHRFSLCFVIANQNQFSSSSHLSATQPAVTKFPITLN